MVHFPHGFAETHPVAVFILKHLHLTKEGKEKKQQSHGKPWNSQITVQLVH